MILQALQKSAKSIFTGYLALLFFMTNAQLAIDPILVKGKDFQDQEKYELAIAEFDKVLEIDKTNLEAQEGIVKSYTFWSWNLKINGQPGDTQLRQADKLAREMVKEYPNSAISYRSLGTVQHYSGDYVNARLSYKKAIDLNPKDAESMFLLWALGEQNASAKLKEPLIQRALEIDPNMADAWQKIGDLQKELKQVDEAIESYQKALSIKPHYVLYYSIASLQAEKSEFMSAKSNYLKSIELKGDFAWAQYGVAYILTMEGDFENAAKYFEKAISLNAQVYPYYQQMLSYYAGLADYPLEEVSSKQVEKAGQIDHGYPEHYEEGIQLAQIFHYEEAVEMLKKADKWERNHENRENMLASINAWLTHCYLETGRYEKAIALSEELLRIQRESMVESDVASLLATIAAVNSYWGRYSEAAKYHNLSVQELQRLGRKDLLSIALMNLSETYREWGKYKQSETYSKQASALCKELGDMSNYALSLNTTARALHKQGNTLDAVSLINEAMKVAVDLKTRHPLVEVQLTKSDLYQSRGQLSEAIDLFNEAYMTINPESFPLHPENIYIFQLGAELSIRQNDIALAKQFFELINANYKAQVKSHFSTMSEQGKIDFYRNIKTDFEKFNSFVAQHYVQYPELISQMMDNQLLYKSLLLSSTKKMKIHILKSGDEELIELYDKWLAKKEFISKLFELNDYERQQRGISIAKLESEKDSLEVILARKTALFKMETAKEPSWKDVKRKLSKDEVIVEMVRFRDYDFEKEEFNESKVSYAAIIIGADTDEHPDFVLLENGNELETKMYRLYSNSIKVKIQESQSYNKYWSAINGLIDGAKTVYFVPDGVYHRLNLNTLHDGEGYLIEKYDIHQITSSRDLLQELRKRRLGGVSYLFGFPNYKLDLKGVKLTLNGGIIDDVFETPLYATLRGGAGEVAELPGTLKEVNAISDMLSENGEDIEVFTRNMALEENLKMVDNPKILHIATHGFFDPKADSTHPLLNSGLLLAGASRLGLTEHEGYEDGILTAYEAMSLSLDETELVVLSACETASGVIENGEGVYGLQRAFMVAGAKGLIMSMWKVDDAATQELMVKFYEYYLEKGDYKEAFRQAQLAVQNKFPEPYYWGAFVFVGR